MAKTAGNVQRRYDYAVRLLRLRTRTSAGLALFKLEAVPDELNPPPRLLDDEGQETLSAASDLIRWMSSESYSLFKLAWQQRLDAADLGVIDRRVADLRDAVNASGKTCAVVSAPPARGWRWSIGLSCAANGTTVNACSRSQTTTGCQAVPKTA